MSERFIEQICNLHWYHPNTSRHVAESLLMQNADEGSYLIRSSHRNDGEMALSVRCKDSVKHFNVNKKNDGFTFGLAEFYCIEELEEHFQNQPFIGGDSGIITWLKYPYPRLVEEPSLYETVKLHAQYGKKRFLEKSSFSIASKEGFLTKLGGCIKNWKVRWFVLRHNQLSYYKSKEEKTPLRTLDLNECKNCQQDHHMGKAFCFFLEFEWRTFYFQCENEAEMREWMRIIVWKLNNFRKEKYANTIEYSDD